MSKAIAFPMNRESDSGQAVPELNLPGPRIWKLKDLAEFLGVSHSWVYKRTEDKAEDPIPRIPGVRLLRFDTHSPAFQAWMRRQLGYVASSVDNGDADE